jgi:hypothetical protein
MALKLGAGISKDVTDLVKGITHSTNSASTNSPIKKGEQLIRGIGNLFSKPKTN